ncbi:sensor histidine kinase [Jannaschia sp. R86511]|uniref:sensor histidine kinase n=1 Tax=Jannaschia sp. R86511 TaxID=3093853 RepID=UPI0036D38354
MTTAEPSVRRPRRTQVQLVELYTRQSLYLVLWPVQAVLLVQVVGQGSDEPEVLVPVGLATLLLTVASVPAMRAAIRLYPAPGPTPWRHLVPLLMGSVLALALVPLLPTELRPTAPLLVWLPLVWTLSGLRSRAWTVATVIASVAVPALGGSVWPTVLGFLIGLFVLFTVRVSLWLEDVVRQLDRARSTRAELAVAEERLRFSRDVHDVLGRRLAAIAVQSELAAALAGRGDPRAAEQMLQVRAGAHEALREARDLARGYRATDLATELDGATSLLRSAGIDLRVAVDEVPPERQEAAAWVVREAVTNVLRHSRARTVDLSWDGVALVVGNDGLDGPGADGPTRDGPPAAPVTLDPMTGGSGLLGLRERLRPLGGDVSAHREPDRFVLRADLGVADPGATDPGAAAVARAEPTVADPARGGPADGDGHVDVGRRVAR